MGCEEQGKVEIGLNDATATASLVRCRSARAQLHPTCTKYNDQR